MKKIRFLIIFFVLVIIWFFSNVYKIKSYSKIYYESKSDVAIVLGAGTSDGRISQVFVERLKHALYLYQNKKVDYILLTGGYGEGQSISDSKAAKNYLLTFNIPDSVLLIEEKSKVTFYNFVEAKKVMQENKLTTALVVSDPYHMKRAMLMCTKVGINGLSSPTPTSMYRSKEVKRKFLYNQAYNLGVYQLFGRFRKTL